MLKKNDKLCEREEKEFEINKFLSSVALVSFIMRAFKFCTTCHGLNTFNYFELSVFKSVVHVYSPHFCFFILRLIYSSKVV